MPQVQLLSEISRQPGDHQPSPYEIFYTQFNETPFFVFHTGITDRYNTPGFDEEDIENDEDDDLPQEGIKHLENEVDALLKHIAEHDVRSTYLKVMSPQNRYLNLESNVFQAYVAFSSGVMVQLRISPTRRRTTTAFTIYAGSPFKNGVDILQKYAEQFIQPPPTKKDKIHIITQSNNDFYLKDIPLKPKKNSKFSFKNYNEDFETVSNHVIKTLTEDNENGLVLFHGDPGTGKTSYLKHLLHTISTKKLIYMPPDLTQHLSSPGFISFMMSEATNSILLIEDAENVLRHREAGGNQAVSNILNLSDGILGDVMKLQIVCTFNSKLAEIDEALLRPGRCIAEYRFEKLAVDRAGDLLADLHGEDVEWDPKEMTLAEVFNYKAPPTRSKDKTIKLGFT